jgi:predicted nucleic acid-binding Zn ribbon protein
MPIIVLECEDCTEKVDFLKIASDETIPYKCELCGGKLKKIISGKVGVKYKCTGFYATDYPTVKTKSERKSFSG